MNRFLRGLGLYGGICLLALAIVYRTLRLDRADLTIPLGYVGGDVMSVGMAFKGILEHGWYLQNPSVGAPHGLDLSDYPTADALNFFWVKVLGWAIRDWGALLNAFFLLGFPLVAAVALFVFRTLGLRTATAGALALLYAFLPYHFWRGEAHIFLGFYYLVPIITLLALRLWDGHPPFFGGGRRAGFLVGAACLAIGSSGLYYAYFGCFFFVLAALSAYLRDRGGKAVKSAALLIALVVAGVAISLAPTIIYQREHGKNPIAVVRNQDEAEVWAMKITQLLVPVDGHRIPAFAQLKARYNEFPLRNENTEMLGLVGSCGFVWLLLRRLRIGGEPGELEDRASILNLGAILLATVGSLGGFLALLADSGIRSYNRMSIFIAFLALLAVGILIDRVRRRFETTSLRRLIGRGLVAVVFALGFLDQVPPPFKPQYAEARAAWESDRDFIRAIEAALPAGALVYQMPYMPFPEHPAIHDLADYDLLRGYLHARGLRWSYGTMKGRPGDFWQRQLAEQSLAERLPALAASGFKGIYVARKGFPDRGAAVESELRDLSRKDPLISRDGNLAFFDLAAYEAGMRKKLGSEQWQAQADRSKSVFWAWTDGCYDREGAAESHWRWCGPTGTLRVYNLGSSPREVRLEARFESGFDAPSVLRLETGAFKDVVSLSRKPAAYSRAFLAAPGETLVRLTSNAARVVAPEDSRHLVFRAIDARLDVGRSR